MAIATIGIKAKKKEANLSYLVAGEEDSDLGYPVLDTGKKSEIRSHSESLSSYPFAMPIISYLVLL